MIFLRKDIFFSIQASFSFSKTKIKIFLANFFFEEKFCPPYFFSKFKSKKFSFTLFHVEKTQDLGPHLHTYLEIICFPI